MKIRDIVFGVAILGVMIGYFYPWNENQENLQGYFLVPSVLLMIAAAFVKLGEGDFKKKDTSTDENGKKN